MSDNPSPGHCKRPLLWTASAVALILAVILGSIIVPHDSSEKNAARIRQSPTIRAISPATDPSHSARAIATGLPMSERADQNIASTPDETTDIEEANLSKTEAYILESVEITNNIGTATSVTEVTEVVEAVKETPDASQQELIAHARSTFTIKNDPRFGNDETLTELANAVAAFYLHYPTRNDCVRLIKLCDELANRTYSEEITLAVKGSKFLFQEEIAMIDKGYTRYGRTYADSNTLARIYARLGVRSKEIDSYLTKCKRDAAAESANRGKTARQLTKKTGSQTSSPRKSKRRIRRIGESNMNELVRPNTPIKRIGEDTDMSQLKRPDTPVKRIGEDTDMSQLKRPDTPIKRIGEDTDMSQLKRPDTPIKRIGEDTNMDELKKPDTPTTRIGEEE